MPDKDDLELAEEKPAKGGKGKLIAMISVGAILVIGLSIGATLYLTGAFSGDDSAEQAESGKGKKSEAKAEAKEKKPAQYFALEPEFIVNFEEQSQASFLQIKIQVMSRDQDALDALEQHMPVVRNNILLLLSGQKFEDVSTTPGKEKLRRDILKAISKVLKKETGASGIDAVYFTSFIMQ